MAHNVRALCRCGIRIPSARTNAWLCTKDKCLEPMFGDVGQARTKAAILLLMIDTTSSRTCTKPIVSGSYCRSTRMLFKSFESSLKSPFCLLELVLILRNHLSVKLFLIQYKTGVQSFDFTIMQE